MALYGVVLSCIKAEETLSEASYLIMSEIIFFDCRACGTLKRVRINLYQVGDPALSRVRSKPLLGSPKFSHFSQKKKTPAEKICLIVMEPGRPSEQVNRLSTRLVLGHLSELHDNSPQQEVSQHSFYCIESSGNDLK